MEYAHSATEFVANEQLAQTSAQSGAQAPAQSLAAADVAAPASEPQNASGMPKVGSFALPLAEMDAVACAAGLQWVNSDPERIAAVRAQIAAEPQPIHIPRERPAAVLMDAGPLVLVETKRDLRNMSLPFEQAAQQQQ
jgi:ribonuclease E